MADMRPYSLQSIHEMGRSKSHRLTLLQKLKPQRASSDEVYLRSSRSTRLSLVSSRPSLSRFASSLGPDEPLPSQEVLLQFTGLHNLVIDHIRKFYSVDGAERYVSQSVIEHASTGIILPWTQILGLLGHAETRLATLAMCIAWTILSRSLLLKLGTSHSPGSTFLPPEIVECFQSFSLGRGALTLGKDDPNPVNYALLSRWKQITASLCHTAYIEDAFSFFDARTVNIERALKDLDPLLSTYAKGQDSGHGRAARLDDLREVLRQGASFSFVLFGQPCFWKFDWRSDRAVANGKTETQVDPETASCIASIGIAATKSIRLATREIVIWPNLVRAMDEDGIQLVGSDEGFVLGKKVYIDDFASIGEDIGL